MRSAPTIYVYVIYGDNSHFDWLASVPFHRKCPASDGNMCLESVHMKIISSEGCASFAWVSHRVDLIPANFVIIVLWLCYMTPRLTLLDLYPSPSIILNSVQYPWYEATPSGSNTSLFKCVCKNRETECYSVPWENY